MWQAIRVVESGPWHVGVGFADVELARGFDAAFANACVADVEAPIAFGATTRPDTGSTWSHGTMPLARVRSVGSFVTAAAWTLAGLADARLGVAVTTDLRVLAFDGGALLLDAPRPELLACREWRGAGLVELPLVRVRVDVEASEIVLPAPRSDLLGEHARWANARLPLRGVVARSLPGEVRDETAARLAARAASSGSEGLFEAAIAARRFRTGSNRTRLADHVLGLLRS